MSGAYLTLEEAEEIIIAAQLGMYELDYPGNRSKLAHARILLAGRGASEDEECDEERVADKDC